MCWQNKPLTRTPKNSAPFMVNFLLKFKKRWITDKFNTHFKHLYFLVENIYHWIFCFDVLTFFMVQGNQRFFLQILWIQFRSWITHHIVRIKILTVRLLFQNEIAEMHVDYLYVENCYRCGYLQTLMYPMLLRVKGITLLVTEAGCMESHYSSLFVLW